MIYDNYIIIAHKKYDITYYIYNHILKNYDVNILKNFHYYTANNVTFTKVKKSNIHIEFEPYCSAIDKNIILDNIYHFCSSMNHLFYTKKNQKKIIIIYEFNLLHIQHQLCILYIIKKFNKYNNFILISNTIDNIIFPILNLCTVIHNINAYEFHTEKKWIQIYKNHNIEFICYWKQILNKIFQTIINKSSDVKFIFKNRQHISTLFVSNFDIDELLLYFHSLFVEHFTNINDIYFITNIFSKYQYLISTSTRYIIHFEALIFNLYNYIHFKSN